MFSFLKRKGHTQAELTFKTRVLRFWEWYASAAPQLTQRLNEGQVSALGPEVNARVDQMIPGCAWVFGPGEKPQEYSLTLTGGEDHHRRFLADYWRSQAPFIEGWTFFSSRQTTPAASHWKMEIGEHVLNLAEFRLVPRLARDSEKVDLTVWHPLFLRLSEKDRWTPIFVVLDAMLGEFGTENWIGQIQVNNCQMNEAISIGELPEFIKKTEAETGWTKHSPMDAWAPYQLPEPHDRFLRGDVIAGTTCHPTLINEYVASEGQMQDALAGTGADYVFVQFDSRILPDGQQVEARNIIESAISEALSLASNGRHLGGAFGAHYTYIDTLIYDGAASLGTLLEVLRNQNLPAGTSIEFFALNKRNQRIVL